MSPRIRRTILASFVTLFVTAAVAAWQRQQTGSVANEKIFDALGVSSGQTICEMGAGNGELSIAVARRVGPSGRVYSSELGADRVKALQDKVKESGIDQITVVDGEATRTNFPDASCDALFMRNVYHHFEQPAAMNASIAAAVKPGGRVAVVDFTPPGKEAEKPEDRDRDGMHGIARDSLIRELKEAGLEHVASESGEQRWFMVVAMKPKS
jgi:ubiquinone/menaquinone biosynthesis C-methylase UbiE